MRHMFVTREVSQLSGWLNWYVCCQGWSRKQGTRCGVGCEPGGGSAARTQRARESAGPQMWARGAAHLKHVVHVRDAGGVPAQKRLVECPRVLPRVARAGHTQCAASCGPGGAGGGERKCAVRTQRARQRLRLQIGARGEGRTFNMEPMFVTREVSQLSGWLKAYALCRGSQAGRTVRAAGRVRRA